MNIFKKLFKRKTTETIFSKPIDAKYFVDNKYGFISKKDLELYTDFAGEYPNLFESFQHKKVHNFTRNLGYIDPLPYNGQVKKPFLKRNQLDFLKSIPDN